MNQSKILTLGAAALIAASSFNAFAKDKDDEYEGGMGAVRDLSTFTSVSLDGSMSLVATAGEDQRVEITADPEMLEYIRTRVRNGELRIWTKRGAPRRGRNKIEINISVAELEGVEINGSGDVVARKIDSEKFAMEINGSGDADLQGKCGSVSYEINGSGDIDAKALKCVDADIEINGSGDAEISATGKLSAEINGSGDIVAFGAPRLNRFSSSGSGSIRTKD